MTKKHKVLLIDCKSSHLWLQNSKLYFNNEFESYNSNQTIPKQLIIISDDEIKENDWFMYNGNDGWMLCLAKKGYIQGIEEYKIISSSNPQLKQIIPRHNDFDSEYQLPLIPKSFIEYFIADYTKGNIIEEVEIEIDLNGCCGSIGNSCFERNHCSETIKLKTNQQNEISIVIPEKNKYDKNINMINIGNSKEDIWDKANYFIFKYQDRYEIIVKYIKETNEKFSCYIPAYDMYFGANSREIIKDKSLALASIHLNISIENNYSKEEVIIKLQDIALHFAVYKPYKNDGTIGVQIDKWIKENL